jgi:hypothetical protein
LPGGHHHRHHLAALLAGQVGLGGPPPLDRPSP